MKKDRQKAIALKYDHMKDSAPKVTATGQGYIAETIITKAKESNVPVLDDPSLVELLANLNINEKIPEELYEAVAEVFSFIYHIDQQVKELDH